MPLSIDIFLPAMPAAADGLGVSAADIQITISAITFGIAIGQPVYGPLADRFGRRPVALASISVFALAGLMCAFAPTVSVLYALRFIQGLAVASARILLRAVIRDLYDGDRAAALLSYSYAAGALMPIAAPVIGGHLTDGIGWRATFIAMAAIAGSIAVGFALSFGESTTPDKTALKRDQLAATAKRILGSAQFMRYTLAGTAPYIGLMALLTGLSPVLIGRFGVSPHNFGYLFAVVMTGHLLASLAAGRLATRLGIDRLILIGGMVCACAGLGGLGLWLAGLVNASILVAVSFCYMAGFALVLPASSAGAMKPFPDRAGRASSLMGLIQVGVGAAAGLVFAWLADGTEGPTIWGMAVAGAITLAGYALVRRPAG
jgi:DHA1 family bicyclomycin/chloramphenicol resistance-like MFS transporter